MQWKGTPRGPKDSTIVALMAIMGVVGLACIIYGLGLIGGVMLGTAVLWFALEAPNHHR